MYNKIAVIGDKDSVLAFKSVGAEVFDSSTADETRALIKKLAVQIPDTLAKCKTVTFPAVVPIPTTEQSSGLGMQGIKNDVEKAIGVDIIFNK